MGFKVARLFGKPIEDILYIVPSPELGRSGRKHHVSDQCWQFGLVDRVIRLWLGSGLQPSGRYRPVHVCRAWLRYDLGSGGGRRVDQSGLRRPPRLGSVGNYLADYLTGLLTSLGLDVQTLDFAERVPVAVRAARFELVAPDGRVRGLAFRDEFREVAYGAWVSEAAEGPVAVTRVTDEFARG